MRVIFELSEKLGCSVSKYVHGELARREYVNHVGGLEKQKIYEIST